MCRITFLTHACGHDSSPAPTQCAIYHNYYSSGSVLDLASTLILSAHECPFAQCHEHTSSAKCAKCTRGRFNLPLDTACISAAANKNEDSSPTCSTGSSATSTYSNEKTLAILESAPLLPHKPLPPTRTEMMVQKVSDWDGWTRMNKWQKKIIRGNFGGEKVRRKIVRSSITDLHSSAGKPYFDGSRVTVTASWCQPLYTEGGT